MTKPRCPQCGEPVHKAGHARGVQRWSHVETKDCNWHGTRPVMPDTTPGVDAKQVMDNLNQLGSYRRFVITSAQNATPINKRFFASLVGYCNHRKARLIVIPYRYKNPTSIWSANAREDDWWAAELVPYIVNKRLDLAPSLTLLADIMTQPTAGTPLSGFETVTGSKSAIIGHPKLALKTVATPQNKLPKILTTTGCVTELNYLQTKVGKKAEHHHTFGACVVEVDGDTFHIRQLNSVADGSFIDLEYEYSGKYQKGAGPAEALVMGDSHLKFLDPKVKDATFSKKHGIVATLRPQHLIWHDVMDFYSRNHHHRDEVFINFAKHHARADNVRHELDETFAFIEQHTPAYATSIIVPSNHPDALARWVKEADPKRDPENAIFWAETFVAMCYGSRMTDSGAKTIDPFAYWGYKVLGGERFKFLRRDESLTLKGIEVGYHGDRGSNGSRGSLRDFSRLGVKTITGHSHSPGIEGGAYRVGTNSRLRLEYNSGPSSWLHTDCVIYSNGKRALINIIDGKWRCKK